jgi:hypothetical protein
MELEHPVKIARGPVIRGPFLWPGFAVTGALKLDAALTVGGRVHVDRLGLEGGEELLHLDEVTLVHLNQGTPVP